MEKLGLTKNNSRLQRALIVRPLIIVLFSIILIVVAIIAGTNQFSSYQANQAINNQKDELYNHYNDRKYETTLSNAIYQTSYIIADEDLNREFISRKSGDSETASEASKILLQLKQLKDEQNRSAINTFGRQDLTIDHNTYRVDVTNYTGSIEDGYVVRDTEGAKYYIVVFVNITPMREFITAVRNRLIIIIIAIFLVAAAFLIIMSHKVSKSFTSLRDYILSVGKKDSEVDIELPNNTYQEFNDITETINEMSNRIEENQRTQQLFFQNASHELRTPLMSIQGYAEGIKENVITDTHQAAEVVLSESQKMTDLVDEILTLTKLEKFEETMHIESISLTDLIYDISWLLKAKADEKGIRIVHRFSSPHIEIDADEQLLERAVKNILGNAIRYAKQTIMIKAKEMGDYIELTIFNDGAAISPEDLPLIFERFYKGKGGQSGIGLSITKEIVKQHHGEISVNSNQIGTEFKIILPKRQ